MESNNIKENIIYGSGENREKNIVRKSLPLMELNKSELSLSELKILDIYLAKIDSHNPENREVTLKKSEIEKIFNIDRIRNDELEIRLKHLIGNILKIEDDSKKKGFTLITLFDKAEAVKEDDESWTITLKCSESAMEYIFNIDNTGYLEYELKDVVNLKSKYSYNLFLLLEKYRTHQRWTISLDNLKELLNCNSEYYDEFKRFNNSVLKAAKKEIEEKTDCRFTYTPLRTGRKIDRVQFDVKPRKFGVPDKKIVELSSEFTKPLYMWINAPIYLKLYLTPVQVKELQAIILSIPESKLPEMEDLPLANIDIRRFYYMYEKTKEVLKIDSEKKIDNKYNYLLKILKRDAGA